MDLKMYQDRDSFKTINSALAKPPTVSLTQRGQENSHSRLDQASCLAAAKAIASCYRRDEAHDPEGFVAGLALTLGDYPASIVQYAADPRTGVVSRFPMGLPNVGQIKEFCDGILTRQERISHYASLGPAKPYEPTPTKPGQITYAEHLELAVQGKTKLRPIGAFEPGGYLGPTT
jgi:hypothetical protein